MPSGAPIANASALAVRLIRSDRNTMPSNSSSSLPISASAVENACPRSDMRRLLHLPLQGGGRPQSGRVGVAVAAQMTPPRQSDPPLSGEGKQAARSSYKWKCPEREVAPIGL